MWFKDVSKGALCFTISIAARLSLSLYQRRQVTKNGVDLPSNHLKSRPSRCIMLYNTPLSNILDDYPQFCEIADEVPRSDSVDSYSIRWQYELIL